MGTKLYLTITKKPLSIAAAQGLKAVEVTIDEDTNLENLIREAAIRIVEDDYDTTT